MIFISDQAKITPIPEIRATKDAITIQCDDLKDLGAQR